MPLKVLVVEDDAPTLELMSEVLSSLGAEVRGCQDGQQAEPLIKHERFDGIFLDLLMPKLDGFALARLIRRSLPNRTTPIVIVTGLGDPRTMQEAFAAGGTFFLRKPVDRNMLTRLLESTRGSMLEERRRFKRVPVRVEVTCRAGSRSITGMSVNLSKGGILFTGDGSLELGSRVELCFRLPRQRLTTEAAGIVVRVEEQQRVAAEFSYISSWGRQRIRDFIARQEQRASP